MFTEEDSIKLLRNYRHIYMNDLQVILGYIQLEKQDKAAEYIKRVSLMMDKESKVYQLKDNDMKLIMIKGYIKARENFIVMTVDFNKDDNVMFARPDYIYIEKTLDKFISQAAPSGSSELYLKLGYNGNATLEKLKG